MTKIIDVVAPVEQEGTKAEVKSWYKKVGEGIVEGEPLVELETDKVAVEVPSPATGVVTEILIDADGEVEPGGLLGRLQVGVSAATVATEGKATVISNVTEQAAKTSSSATTAHEHRLSPSVRRLVREHDLQPSLINGTGKGGRLTRGDIQAFIENGAAPFIAKPLNQPVIQTKYGPARQIPHDSMRRRIAEHMSHSVQTAPHVTAVFEADFSAIIAHRNTQKHEYKTRGAKLTFTAYFIAACVEAMKVTPTVNSRWHKDHLEVFEDVNIGVGVALGDKGLIVPVVARTQSLSLFEIAQELQALTDKARNNALAPADVRGGTFSISNHGTSGSIVATPIIINQPQSAILGVGKLEKRVVVRTVDGVDAIQIRPMAYVSLTIDHRVLDGAQTNAWLTRFVEVIESWPEA
ncbi:MAG: dihydrolipoamide succinyltransferase [Alphaproteobacteria bacterium]|nr:dihydrolipoamide succinyltransferase [Alphaproteobacteria bacterium]